MKVNILGTEYEIITEANISEYPKLENNLGYTDFSIKQIVISKMEPDDDTVEDLTIPKNKTLKHEIIHAFLYESGLDSNSWARNEEIVDWIALQSEKMFDIFKKVDALSKSKKSKSYIELLKEQEKTNKVIINV